MKRCALLAAWLVLLPSPPSAQPAPDNSSAFWKNLSVQFTGGMARFGMGDWNEYYGSLKSSYGRLRGGVGAKFYGNDFRYGKDGELEIRYSFHPQYRVGIAIGRGWGGAEVGWNRKTSYTFQDNTTWNNEDIRDISIDARITPVLLTFYTNASSYPYQPYIGLGVGYYFSSFQQTEDVDYYSRTDTLEAGGPRTLSEMDVVALQDGKMSAGGFGFHAVIGSEYFLRSNLSLIGEIKGRYVKISGYEGTETTAYPDSTTTRDVQCVVFSMMDESGEYKVAGFGSWPKDEPLPPPEATYRYRKGVLDFSGVSIRFGLSYHF